MPTNERPQRRSPRPGATIEHGSDASGRDRETRRELAKLTGTFLNGIAVAVFAVGGLAPLVAILSGRIVVTDGRWVVVSCAASFFVSLVAHFLARYVVSREFRR